MSTLVPRAIFAALLVAAVAIGGALYIGYHKGLTAGESGYDIGAGKLASLGLRGILPQVTDQQLVNLTFRQVAHVYYRSFSPQQMIDGERSGLERYLRATFASEHLHLTPTLPAVQDGANQSSDLRALDAELAYARNHYSQYLHKDGSTLLTQAALDGMLASLHDPYTVYLSPDQIRALNEELSGGNFGGIGVFIYELRDGRIVIDPIAGLPAARAGMRGEEIVQSINGSTIAGKTLDQVERMIRGPQGTVVTLMTQPYGTKKAPLHFRITREIIHVPTVHQEMQDGYNYIRLSDFGQTSADEVHKALLAGVKAGAKGTILDLRDNGGGLLDAAVSISSFFVPQGVVVTEIDRYGNRDPSYAQGDVVHGVKPLVILVNGYTASASEITAGALQDYKLATLIGTKTFGKGVVQGIFTMPNGGALKITTERYVTPAGRDIQHKGIEPNIVVHECPKPASCQIGSLIGTSRDKQLNAAKAFLRRLAR